MARSAARAAANHATAQAAKAATLAAVMAAADAGMAEVARESERRTKEVQLTKDVTEWSNAPCRWSGVTKGTLSLLCLAFS